MGTGICVIYHPSTGAHEPSPGRLLELPCDAPPPPGTLDVWAVKADTGLYVTMPKPKLEIHFWASQDCLLALMPDHGWCAIQIVGKEN